MYIKRIDQTAVSGGIKNSCVGKEFMFIFAKIDLMKENLKEIIPGKGLGTLRFGLSRDEVKAMLGAPTDTERYTLSDEDCDTTEAWHYDELQLSLSFDEEYDWKLSSIAVSSEEYTLEGQSLIGRKKGDILQEFEKRQWGEPEEDEEVREDNPDNCLIHIDKGSMSLWFENDELTELQIGPFFKNEEILWPGQEN